MHGKIAAMYTAINSARAFVCEVAKACDLGQVTHQDAVACCLYVSEQGMAQAHQAVQALGGRGVFELCSCGAYISRCQIDGKPHRHILNSPHVGGT